MYKWIAAFVLASVAALWGMETVRAETVVCLGLSTTTRQETVTSTRWVAQTFTLADNRSVVEVVGNLYDLSNHPTNAVSMFIREIDTVTGFPMAANLATVTKVADLLPAYPGLGAESGFDCDNLRESQTFTLSSPLALTAGVEYVVIFRYATSGGCAVAVCLATQQVAGFGPGHALECVGSGCAASNTGWNVVDAWTDAPVAILDAIVTVPPPSGSIDSWLLQLLGDIGLDDEAGRLLAALIGAAAIFVLLAAAKAHPLIILTIDGLWIAGTVLLPLVLPWIVLVGLVVLIAALIIAVVILKGGGDE